MLVALQNVQYGYDDKIVLENITANIEDGDRIGLIGTNGAGKSTLLNLICGSLTPDAGSVFSCNHLKIGYLRQGTGLDIDNTVFAEVKTVFNELYACEQSMRDLECEMAELDHNSVEYRRVVQTYNALSNEFTAGDGYQIEVKIRTVLNGMGFSGRYEDSIRTMSGGEKTRLALCKLLLEPLDLLILDEPTNHLDFLTLQWLENYLDTYHGGLLVVSHDRYFLDRTIKNIWEIENGRLLTFRGNYSSYKVQKSELRERQQKEYDRQQLQISEMLTYAERNIVRATTSKSAKSRIHQVANMEKLEKPIPPVKPPVFRFSFEADSVKDVLSVSHVEVGYTAMDHSQHVLIHDVNLELKRGGRLAIIGGNGTGKSTLLKHLLRAEHELCSGVIWGKNVKTSYYDQENLNLNFENTVIDELWGRFLSFDQTTVRGILGSLNLGADDILKKVSVLSGGERVKLGFAILTAEHGNTLILDEPTNHLDLMSREALESALKKFAGTLLFVSHDRYFLNAVASRVAEIENERLTVYDGNYEDFLAIKRALADRLEQSAPPPVVVKSVAGGYRSAKQRSEEVKLKSNLRSVELRIEELEKEQNQLNEEIISPEIAADYKRLRVKCEQLDLCKSKLETAYEEWATISMQLE